jgi:DNA-binding HxlR family transcriptional regulator
MAKKRSAAMAQRSGCAINLATEVLGDRWSLVVLRDMMFGNWRHFRELLANSMEGIASNILAARLKHLQAAGLITCAEDPTHKQKLIYSLTEPAIQLVPVLATLGEWGRRHLPVTRELSIRAQVLFDGGPAMWDDFMDELRELHLGQKRRRSDQSPRQSVLKRLNDAYEAERVKSSSRSRRIAGG